MPRIPGLTDWPSGAVPDAWDRVALYDWSVDRTYDAPLVALTGIAPWTSSEWKSVVVP